MQCHLQSSTEIVKIIIYLFLSFKLVFCFIYFQKKGQAMHIEDDKLDELCLIKNLSALDAKRKIFTNKISDMLKMFGKKDPERVSLWSEYLMRINPSTKQFREAIDKLIETCETTPNLSQIIALVSNSDAKKSYELNDPKAEKEHKEYLQIKAEFLERFKDIPDALSRFTEHWCVLNDIKFNEMKSFGLELSIYERLALKDLKANHWRKLDKTMIELYPDFKRWIENKDKQLSESNKLFGA